MRAPRGAVQYGIETGPAGVHDLLRRSNPNPTTVRGSPLQRAYSVSLVAAASLDEMIVEWALGLRRRRQRPCCVSAHPRRPAHRNSRRAGSRWPAAAACQCRASSPPVPTTRLLCCSSNTSMARATSRSNSTQRLEALGRIAARISTVDPGDAKLPAVTHPIPLVGFDEFRARAQPQPLLAAAQKRVAAIMPDEPIGSAHGDLWEREHPVAWRRACHGHRLGLRRPASRRRRPRLAAMRRSYVLRARGIRPRAHRRAARDGTPRRVARLLGRRHSAEYTAGHRLVRRGGYRAPPTWAADTARDSQPSLELKLWPHLVRVPPGRAGGRQDGTPPGTPACRQR
jgi:hypothetical protein